MNTFRGVKKQQGVVLVVSLVFLIALTAVAAVLMQNSTMDMKMSGATEDKTVALQEVVGAVDEVIYNQIGPGATNLFARPATGENFPINDQAALLPGTASQVTATVTVENNQYKLDITCPHLKVASSTEVFTCNVLKINTNRNYGRNDHSRVIAETGIAQQLLK